MTYRVKFTATRPDTSKPFFYDAPEHAEQMAIVDAIREDVAAAPGAIESYSKTISDDGLTCTINFEFGDPGSWHRYMSKINTALPRGIIDRNTYFLDHNHTLAFTWTDDLGETGTIVQVA